MISPRTPGGAMGLGQCHPLRDMVSEQIETYILAHWEFASEQEKQGFLTADLSGLACQCFAHALDDRIHMAALLLSAMFLIDARLGEMDIDDGEDYLDHLQDAVKGFWDCDRSRPDEWMLCDLFAEMQSHDYLLVGDIVNSTLAQLRTRNRQRRSRTSGPGGDWSSLRNHLVGDELIALLLTFVMDGDFDADRKLRAIVITSSSAESGQSAEESRGRRRRRRGESKTSCCQVAVTAENLRHMCD